jgi:hypothetical protein
MYWQPWRWSRDEWLGAWLGVTIPTLLVGALLIAGSRFEALAFSPAIALGGWVGGFLCRRVIEADSSVRIGLRAGLVATAAGAVVWAMVETIGTIVTVHGPFLERLTQAAFIAILVALYSVFFGLPVALPIGVLGSAVLRSFARHRRTAHSALSVASVMALALLAFGLRQAIRS